MIVIERPPDRRFYVIASDEAAIKLVDAFRVKIFKTREEAEADAVRLTEHRKVDHFVFELLSVAETPAASARLVRFK